jgi:hypothetical protein
VRSTTAVGTPTRQAVAPPPPTFPPGRNQGARGNELVDLQRSIDAQRAAKSFKLTLTESFSGQKSTDTTMEVTCPDRWRMFTTSDTGRKMEVVRIGRDAYVREERGPWTTIPAPLGVGSPCYDEQAELDPAHIYDEESDAVARLLSMSTHASLRQTAVRDVNGTPCQEWTVSLPPEGSLDQPQVVVCTGQTDYLPRRIALFDGTRPLMVATFYDWNVPNSIERPGSFV